MHRGKTKEKTQAGEVRQRAEGETGGRGRWREEKQTERAHTEDYHGADEPQ